MFPKKGNLFPGRNDRASVRENFPAIVARALRAELGLSHRAAKTLMSWTGASERAVKQWLTGTHGPRGEHLIALLRESDAVFESVMIAADRHDVALAARALAAQASLDDLLAHFEDLEKRPRRKHSPDGPMPSADLSGTEHDRENDRNDDRNDDRKNDRDSALEDRPIRWPGGPPLNPRQRWYLVALRSGLDVRVSDLRRHWGVSEKTARRDVAALKAWGMISFRGSRRRGRYQPGG